MIFQEDAYLNMSKEFDFKRGGCGLFAITHKAVATRSYVFERETFLNDCHKMKDAGILAADCTILNWNRVCQTLGLPYYIVIENGTHKIDDLHRDMDEDEFQLLYLYNPKTKKHHFVEGDRNDCICYDSMMDSVTSEAYRIGIAKIESRRVFRHK